MNSVKVPCVSAGELLTYLDEWYYQQGKGTITYDDGSKLRFTADGQYIQADDDTILVAMEYVDGIEIIGDFVAIVTEVGMSRRAFLIDPASIQAMEWDNEHWNE